MSYQVLARKWRPKTFEDMVGQSHILKALSNALDKNRLHHAYLFTGTRGVGKTTLARILAKCLNCEKGVSSKPCNECNACIAVDEGRFVDLIKYSGSEYFHATLWILVAMIIILGYDAFKNRDKILPVSKDVA